MNTDHPNTPTQQGVAEAQLRKSSQFLMPVQLNGSDTAKVEYNIYPVHSLGTDKIFNGYNSLAQYIVGQKTVVIDGYDGIFWKRIQISLNKYFTAQGLKGVSKKVEFKTIIS